VPRRSPGSPPSVYVALLRGVNVGGNNMVSMKDLKGSFEHLGFQDVATYINSGNVLFRSSETDPRGIEEEIDSMLAKRHALKGGTVVRSYAEMFRLVRTIDRTWTMTPEWRYNVIFLRHAIDSRAILETLAPKPDIENVVYCPGTLLWSARASDITRTTMVKLSGKPVYRQMTVRNVNTTTKLAELMRRMEQGQ
jgi:uncharacterized protein (DUF1697 family)